MPVQADQDSTILRRYAPDALMSQEGEAMKCRLHESNKRQAGQLQML